MGDLNEKSWLIGWRTHVCCDYTKVDTNFQYQSDWRTLHGVLVGCLALMRRKSDTGAVSSSDATVVARSFMENLQVQSYGQQDRKVRFIYPILIIPIFIFILFCTSLKCLSFIAALLRDSWMPSRFLFWRSFDIGIFLIICMYQIHLYLICVPNI